jgi:hypothetical protein
MTVIVLLAYAIALLISEDIREQIYQGKKSKLYPGVFILLKHRIWLAKEGIGESIASAYSLFGDIIIGSVQIMSEAQGAGLWCHYLTFRP